MRQDVENWIRDLGFDIPELRFDGEFVRFGNKKSSWFVAREFNSPSEPGKQYYAATIGDWKLGEIHHFQNAVRLKPNEKKQVLAQQELYKTRIDRERNEAYEKCAKDSEIIFGTYKHGEHAYAEKKGIKVNSDCRISEDFLAIPLRDVNGKFWSFQKIFPDSTKRFFTGGRTKNNFYQFGEIKNTVRICEGYATGYTIFEKEKDCVICAMSAGNIPNVAQVLKEKHPKLEFIYMADRDEHGKGEEMCKKAMKITGGELRFPPDGFKDFNDARETSLVPVVDEEFILGELPHMTGGKHPRPKCTKENVSMMLDRLGVTVRYNVIKKKVEIMVPGKTYTLDNKDNVSLNAVENWAIQFDMSTSHISKHILSIADGNPFNPVATWITSVPWDGIDRLSDLYQTVQCKNEERDGLLKEALIRRWMISCVAAAFEPNGISAHGMLILQGNQNLGKTTWVKNLVPDELEVIDDGFILELNNKDNVKAALSNWIVELGEMESTFKKSDIAQLKAFVTKKKDTMRLPYMQMPSEYGRRTIFFGSVNDQEFLADKTGNRRFWTIECLSVNFQHNIDLQQLWAQIYSFYKAGELWYLTKEEFEQLNASNEKFEMVDPASELLSTKLNWESDKSTWEWKTTTDITESLGYDPTSINVSSVSRGLRKISELERKRLKGKNLILIPRPKI